MTFAHRALQQASSGTVVPFIVTQTGPTCIVSKDHHFSSFLHCYPRSAPANGTVEQAISDVFHGISQIIFIKSDEKESTKDVAYSPHPLNYLYIRIHRDVFERRVVQRMTAHNCSPIDGSSV